MKAKRAGYLQKVTQGNKKNPKVSPMPAPTELQEEKHQTDAECSGCCSISWKPPTTAR